MSITAKQDDIKKILTLYEDRFCALAEGKCKPDSIEEAKNQIGENISSISHRLSFIKYIKNIVTGFDWKKFHEFDDYASKSQARTVTQISLDKKTICSFKSRKDMENYFFCNLIAYFSLIAGIVDNIAFSVKVSFNLDLGSFVPTPTRIYKAMPDCSIKDGLYTGILTNMDFADLMEIRKKLEHYEHNKAFQYGKRAVISSLGGWHSDDAPYVNEKLVKNLPVKNRRADHYCEYIHEKLEDFLKSFLNAVLKN